MKEVVSLLQQLNLTLSSCESVTGGLFAKSITDIAGVSQVFKGGIVAYNNQVKINVVQVSQEIIKKYTAVSKECALAMAQNTKAIFQSDIAVSFTGNAGPSESESKPVGLIYLAIVFDDYFIIETLNLSGTRIEIRNEIIRQIEKILLANLEKLKKESPK